MRLVTALRRRVARLRYWWRVRVRPSPIQREFNRGDPHGTVRAYADLIVRELIADMEREEEENP